MAEPEPTLHDVLRKLDEVISTLADHGAKLEALTGDLAALRADMETHGRETRRELVGLPEAVSEAVVAAVDRTLGERVRELERDVAELKR